MSEPTPEAGQGHAPDAAAESETEVCVVGAGPAGLVLALLLARAGLAVTVVEKSSSFDREYRGEILQPGGMALLDQLGVLGPARDRGCIEHDAFQLVQRGRILLDADYRRLPRPYDCLLSIPQRHLLEALLDACRRHSGFRYLPGTRLSSLVREAGAVRGVDCVTRDGRHSVRARCVVGADGRYSKARRLAEIPFEQLPGFDLDVLWFRLPDEQDEKRRTVRIYREAGAPAMIYHSYPDQLQVGWTLPRGAYPAIAAEGIGHVAARVGAALPRYRELIAAHLTSFNDVSLLQAFAGRAQRWADSGLLLIGDSAHTHSPVGAQGINLAIQDAVQAYPVVAAAARAGTPSAALGDFETRRSPAVAQVMRMQAMQSKAMLEQRGLAELLRPVAARVVKHTPAAKRILSKIAYGDPTISVPPELR